MYLSSKIFKGNLPKGKSSTLSRGNNGIELGSSFGVTSNSFAKSAEGFTLIIPSIITAITIVLCMYALLVSSS